MIRLGIDTNPDKHFRRKIETDCQSVGKLFGNLFGPLIILQVAIVLSLMNNIGVQGKKPGFFLSGEKSASSGKSRISCKQEQDLKFR